MSSRHSRWIVAIGFTVVLYGVLLIPAIASQDRSDAQPADGTEKEDVPIRPYLAFSGPDSVIDYRAFVLARDKETWEDLWRKHKGDYIERTREGRELIPEVDFNTCMVLGIFSPLRDNCDGEFIYSIEDEGRHLLIRFDTRTFDAPTMSTVRGHTETTPYGIFIIPRFDKKVVIEENDQENPKMPAVWNKKVTITPGRTGELAWVKPKEINERNRGRLRRDW